MADQRLNENIKWPKNPTSNQVLMPPKFPPNLQFTIVLSFNDTGKEYFSKGVRLAKIEF